MIAIIRIKGMIGIQRDVRETLDKLRLRKKYACVIVRDKPEILGMLKKVRDFVAYGKINKETLVELIEKRAKALPGAKIDAEKIAGEFIEGKTEKKFSELGMKPFFSLHPPRGGIKSKVHFPKGILGNNKDKINELLERML